MDDAALSGRIRSVAPPEPDLTADMLVERAAALRPLLRAQQAENDRRGYYSDEIHEAFLKAGFYRILHPRRFGGYQMPPSVFLRVVMELARGHPSTAWCFTIGGSHGYFLASHYPEAVQAELFGPEGEFRSGQVVGPAGTLTPVEGGYRLSGTWSFCSGCPISTHMMVGSLLPQPDGPPRLVFSVVRREDFTILPDWGEGRFMGMQGSGSNSIRVEDVFVPERYIVGGEFMMSSEAFPEGTPGVRVHKDPIYQFVAVGWFHCEFGAILSGAARAALDEFGELARTRTVFGDPATKRIHDPFVQHLYGVAAGQADSAAALTLAACELHEEHQRRSVRDGRPISEAETVKVWSMAREACRLAAQAVEDLFHAAGASAGRSDNRLQRYFRDIEMYRLHIQSQPTFPTRRGKIEFGIPVSGLG